MAARIFYQKDCNLSLLEGKKIALCGDLAADLSLTEKFIQMGIDELSVAPSQVLALRKKIREIQ